VALIAALITVPAIVDAGDREGGWFRFGRGKREPAPAPPVVSLDRYLPVYDLSEQDNRRIAAPAPITYFSARNVDVQRSPLIRAVLQSRNLILRERSKGPERRPLLDQVHAMGWTLLSEVPGRAMVFGAVSRPWESKVQLYPLGLAQFKAFRKPGWAKIVWTLEVDPAGASRSVFRTQTRVATTDANARRRFRTFWRKISPGVVLVRQQALGLIQGDAERRAREAKRGRER
jgi:hypothetical protein